MVRILGLVLVLGLATPASAAVFQYITDNFFKVVAGPQSWTAECPAGQTLNRVVLVGQSIMGEAIENASKSGWVIQSANIVNDNASGFVLALTKQCK